MTAAPYVATIASGVCSIIGGAVLAGAWSGEVPKKSGAVVGLGLLGLGVAIALQQQGSRR